MDWKLLRKRYMVESWIEKHNLMFKDSLIRTPPTSPLKGLSSPLPPPSPTSPLPTPSPTSPLPTPSPTSLPPLPTPSPLPPPSPPHFQQLSKLDSGVSSFQWKTPKGLPKNFNYSHNIKEWDGYFYFEGCMSRPVLYTILTSFFFFLFFFWQTTNPFGAPELPKKTILGGIFSPSEFLIIDESKVAPTNPIKKERFSSHMQDN